MHRIALLGIAVAALAMPPNAAASLFFLLDRSQAAANEHVTVRTGGTPRDFAPGDRVKPFLRSIRLYLVREALAAQVHTRLDSRVHFVGSIVLDRNVRGLLTFTVPALDAGTYTVAFWCPGCAASSRGRTFFVQDVDEYAPRYRSQALLTVATPTTCPATVPNGNRPPGQPRTVSWYGNGLLWAGVASDGVYAVPPARVAADGSIGNKLLWVTTPPWRAPTISGERIGAPALPLRVLGVNQGSFSGAVNPSFMTPVVFPAAGCWRLRARLDDLSLTYVVEVVVR